MMIKRIRVKGGKDKGASRKVVEGRITRSKRVEVIRVKAERIIVKIWRYC
jgi:hypothetical protein